MLSSAVPARRPLRGVSFAVLLISAPASFALIGCTAALSPLATHTAAFAGATNTVAGNSEDAYRAAIKLHDDEQIAQAVSSYDTDPHWDPYKAARPLLTEDQLEARVDVLDGLKSYAQTIADLAGGDKPGKDNPDKNNPDKIDAAAASVGSNLQTLSTALTAKFPKLPAATTAETNAVSTAIKALGDFLVDQKVKESLPKTIELFDPDVARVCDLLESDITVIRRQSNDDYHQLVDAQDNYIRHSSLAGTERRSEIAKIPALVRQQKATDELLQHLQTAIKGVAETHHALAVAAKEKHPESLKARIADLEAAGRRLASYYQSLSSSASTAATT